MTMLVCWVKRILVRLCRPAAFAALAVALVSAAPQKSSTKKAAPKSAPKKAAAKKAAPKTAPAPAHDLAGFIRAYREAPTPAHLSAVNNWIAAHPKDAQAAKLGLGVAQWEQKNFTASTQQLEAARARFPQVPDYVAYYLNAARIEMKDGDSAARDLATVRTAVPSPLNGKLRVLEARALTLSSPARAIALLRERYAELPQPDADFYLAEAYAAAQDAPHAAQFYQRAAYLYPGGDAARKAEDALRSLRDTLGASFPAPSAELLLRRGDRLLELKDYARARAAFETASAQLSGEDRDRALARIGAVEIGRGNARIALAYLQGLEFSTSEAEAERLSYVADAGRKGGNEGAMVAALDRLAQSYPRSPWRARALASAANRFLIDNRPDQYVPLYRALYENFPADPQAAQAHWKVAFAAHLAGQADATELLREQVRMYPASSTSASALYFLGRRAEASADAGAARAYYARILETYPNQYYGVLARDRMALPALRNTAPSPVIQSFLADISFPRRGGQPQSPTPATTARIERSRVLRYSGLGDLADAELRFGARNDGQPGLLAVEMASAADTSFQALRAMKALAGDYLNLPLEAAPRTFWEYLFPLPWRTDVQRNAADKELDPYLLAGLIRQESEFNPKAVSRAKAYGLTQIRPPTGRMFARKEGVARVTTSALMQPETNLKLGAAILRSMNDHQGGQWERTLAAYNAGPGRVANWITWASFREPAEFVETIPFTETREYVQAVLRNADIYRRLYKQ